MTFIVTLLLFTVKPENLFQGWTILKVQDIKANIMTHESTRLFCNYFWVFQDQQQLLESAPMQKYWLHNL